MSSDISENLILNSIPKSGSNLLNKLIEAMGYCYSNKLSLSARSALANPLKFLTRTPLLGSKKIYLSYETSSVVSVQFVKRILRKGINPNYVKAHLAYNKELEILLKENCYKQIFLIRDPRDVLISYCHYVKTFKKHLFYKHFKNLDLNQTCDCLLEGGVFNGYDVIPFKDAFESMTKWIDKDLAIEKLLVKFEKLVGEQGGGNEDDKFETLDSIKKFLSITEKIDESKLISAYGKSHTFRKGKINNWKEQKEINFKKFDSLHSLAKNYGY